METQGTPKPARSRATSKANGRVKAPDSVPALTGLPLVAKESLEAPVEVKTFCLEGPGFGTIPAGWIPFAASGPIVYAYKSAS